MEPNIIYIEYLKALELSTRIKRSILNDTLVISNVPSLNDAANLLQNKEFLNNIQDLIVIRFKILNNLTNVINERLNSTEMEPIKSILFSFESIAETSQMIFILKSKKLKNFVTIDCTKGFSGELGCFMRDFLMNCLKAENFNFPINFGSSSLSLSHLVDSNGYNLLMKAVSDNKENLIHELLKNFPFDINATSELRKTAADIAWKNQFNSILVILLKHNSRFPKNFNEFEASEDIRKALKSNKHQSRGGLMSRCFISPLETRSTSSKLIKEAFDLIKANPNTELLMEMANLTKTKFFFYFGESSASKSHPSSGAGKSGSYNYGNDRSIIVKQLLSETNPTKVAAIIVHELCHSIMTLVFNNHGLPYAVDNEDYKKIFTEITENCKALKDYDEIIQAVFEVYDESLWQAELIVRPPHIMAHYHNNPEKLIHLKSIYHELFQFYEFKVTPAMIAAKKVHSRLADQANMKFKDLTEPLKRKIAESSVSFQGREVKLAKIIESEKDLNLLTSQQIYDLQDNERLMKIGEQINYLSVYVPRDFIKGEKSDEKSVKSANEGKNVEKSSNDQKDVEMSISEMQIDEKLSNKRKIVEKAIIEKKNDKKLLNKGENVEQPVPKYDQREIIEMKVDEKSITELELIEKSQNSCIKIISDQPGTGKSTAMKHIQLKLKELDPEKFILIINLKKFVEDFTKKEIEDAKDVSETVKKMKIKDSDDEMCEHVKRHGKRSPNSRSDDTEEMQLKHQKMEKADCMANIKPLFCDFKGSKDRDCSMMGLRSRSTDLGKPWDGKSEDFMTPSGLRFKEKSPTKSGSKQSSERDTVFGIISMPSSGRGLMASSGMSSKSPSEKDSKFSFGKDPVLPIGKGPMSSSVGHPMASYDWKNPIKTSEFGHKSSPGFNTMETSDLDQESSNDFDQKSDPGMDQESCSVWYPMSTSELVQKLPPNLQTIIDILISTIEIKDQLTQKIFTNLFNTNRVILLLDGLDEIKPKFAQNFIQILQVITTQTKNKIWITTRPQNTIEMMTNFNIQTFKLKPLSEKQVEDLIRQHLELDCIERKEKIDGRMIDDLLKKTASLYGRFKGINNPLILSKIVEKSNDDKENLSLYNVYTEMVDNMMSCSLIWQIHQVFALKLLFGKNSEFSLPNFSILKKWHNAKIALYNSEINRLGFLTLQKGSFKFTHQTYAEYFAATFLIYNLFEELRYKELIELIKFMVILADSPSWRFVADFQDNQVKKLIFPKDEMIKFFKSDTFKSFIVNKMKIYFQTPKKVTGLPVFLDNLIPFLKNEKEIVDELVKINDETKINPNETVLRYFILNSPRFEAILAAIETFEVVYGNQWIQKVQTDIQEIHLPQNLTESLILLGHNYEEKEKINVSNLFRVFTLNRVLSSALNADFVRKFLESHFAKILNFAFRSSLLVDQIFEIFSFILTPELVKNALSATHFHNYSIFYDFSGPFIANYRQFWMNLEKIFNAQQMKMILMHDYKDSPLTLALRYDIKEILNFYLKYCEKSEIANFMINNRQSLVENLEEIKKIDQLNTVKEFLVRIFPVYDNSARDLLTKEFSDDNLTILSYLQQAKEDYIKRNEKDCEKIVKELRNIFIELRRNQGNELLPEIPRNKLRQPEKRALGVKYFSVITIMPFKHPKRVNNFGEVPKFVVDP